MKRTIILSTITAVLLSACLGTGKKKYHPYPLPEINANLWFSKWQQQISIPSSPKTACRAIGKIRIEKDRKPVHASINALIGDNLLYIEITSLLFPTFIGSITKNTVEIYDSKENTLYTYSRSRGTFNLLGIPIGADALTRAVRGLPAAQPEIYMLEKILPQKGMLKIKGTTPSGLEAEATVIPALSVLRKETWLKNKKKVFYAEYNNYKKCGPSYIPTKILWKVERGSIIIKWKKIEFLKDVPYKIFKISLPKGAKIKKSTQPEHSQ